MTLATTRHIRGWRLNAPGCVYAPVKALRVAQGRTMPFLVWTLTRS
ncbi:hypothetical protein [Ktedonospora formicarum]|nr:hypothetical protein [Ktedonospora formicarum]